jgi:6-phosphogluconolactonase
LIHDALAERGIARVALSGGSTPTRLYRRLAAPPFSKAIDWSKVHLYLADERFLPHDHPDSTTRLIRESLLSGIELPEDHFHPMPTAGIPEDCARDYQRQLDAFFEPQGPGLDLALLGMGPDGHTASLFPGLPDLLSRVGAVHQSPKPPATRLSLSREALNSSRAIWFLITGADKAKTLKRVFDSDLNDPKALPAARIEALDHTSLWLTDPAAAAELRQPNSDP